MANVAESRIAYQQADLDEVLRYFSDGFVAPTGEQIVSVESFVDLSKRQVVFRMFIQCCEPKENQ